MLSKNEKALLTSIITLIVNNIPKSQNIICHINISLKGQSGVSGTEYKS